MHAIQGLAALDPGHRYLTGLEGGRCPRAVRAHASCAAARLLATHLGAGEVAPGEAVHATLARPLVAALASL